MPVAVTVLGGSGTFPAPGAACSGYLFRSANTNLWVDMGPGTFPNLQSHLDPADVHAIVLTHVHLDHITDFLPYTYWKRFGPGKEAPPIDVYAPAGTGEFLGHLAGGDPTYEGHVNFKEIDSTLIETIGDFELRFCRTRHPVETYAIRALASSQTIVYTADTGPSRPVTDFAWGANLLIAEASFQQTTKEGADLHMTAQEAGQMAAQAQVTQLALTHIVPGLDPKVSIEQAAREYRGEIHATSDNLRIVVY
ncbi:MAG TPA: MBL fold metallo-hydrolase [Actinomycetota bacterium]|nr:MBL fold metallo-hydrolase [Actinomycetota bacterium]